MGARRTRSECGGDVRADLKGGWPSTDGGASWSIVYSQAFSFVSGIAIDSRSPSRVYLATWSNSSESITSPAQHGLLVSVDGGSNWSPINSPQSDPNLAALAIDLSSPNALYVVTRSGILFRTTDAGDHWTDVTDASLAAAGIGVIVVPVPTSATVYAGGASGLSRSSDSGATWNRPALGLRNVELRSLAVDPVAPSKIYAAIGHAVTKTTDGGAHWTDLGLGAPGHSIQSIVIDPAAPDTLYATGGSANAPPLYKSTDAGAHWARIGNGLPASPVTVLAVAASQDSTLYGAMQDAGVAKSVNGGATWTRTQSIPAARPAATLAIDPTNANVVYVATPPFEPRPGPQDPALFKTTNGGAQWMRVPIGLIEGHGIASIAIDPVAPSTIYVATVDNGGNGNAAVYKSTDGGATWSPPAYYVPQWTQLFDNNSRNLAINPKVPWQIYAATQSGVFMSADGATSWTPLNTGLPTSDVESITIDRSGTLLRVATVVGPFEYQIVGASPPGTVPAIEYIHAASGDYFLTTNPAAIGQLDGGTFAGWTRTGLQFNVYPVAAEGTVPVCQFFSNSFAPKFAHFFTPFAAECAVVQANPNWALESAAAFYVGLPTGDGSCAAGRFPVYRLFNNGQGGVLLHRYTTDLAVRAHMIAQGWLPEGLGANAVAMCAPQ